MRKTLLLGFAILGVSAFAASNKTFNMTLTQESVVEGKTLKPGDYKVSFENGAAVIKKGRETLEVPAHEENDASKYSATSLVYQNDGKLSEVRFGGTHTKIIFEGENSMQTGQ